MTKKQELKNTVIRLANELENAFNAILEHGNKPELLDTHGRLMVEIQDSNLGSKVQWHRRNVIQKK